MKNKRPLEEDENCFALKLPAIDVIGDDNNEMYTDDLLSKEMKYESPSPVEGLLSTPKGRE